MMLGEWCKMKTHISIFPKPIHHVNGQHVGHSQTYHQAAAGIYHVSWHDLTCQDKCAMEICLRRVNYPSYQWLTWPQNRKGENTHGASPNFATFVYSQFGIAHMKSEYILHIMNNGICAWKWHMSVELVWRLTLEPPNILLYIQPGTHDWYNEIQNHLVYHIWNHDSIKSFW